MAPNKYKNYTLNAGEKLLYGILFGFTYLLSLLPMRVLYLLSDVVLYPLLLLIRYRGKVIQRNLMSSFPEKSKKEIAQLQRDFYRYFGDLILETIKGISISKKEMNRRMQYHNIERIAELAGQGRSVVIYLGHYCNWEWVTSLGLHMPTEAYSCQIYHILQSKVFDKYMLHIRARMGTHNIPAVDTIRETIRLHKSKVPMVCGYIADQVPHWNNIHYWTNFLHHDTPCLSGAETMAKRFDQAVFYLDIRRVKRGYYEIDVIEMAEHSKDIPDWDLTEQYFRLLEKSIQRQPAYWLWSHNRWKRTREEYNQIMEARANNE
ncbi:MAG: lysophospholipid acyltransferase family protein [Bacteroidales bacterium]|nr:lysophospholipid acyltransferase family protein [Bacteroidales bacterium]